MFFSEEYLPCCLNKTCRRVQAQCIANIKDKGTFVYENLGVSSFQLLPVSLF